MIIQVAWMFNDTQKIGGPTLQEKGQLVQRSKDDEQVQLGPNLPRSKTDEQVHLSILNTRSKDV